MRSHGVGICALHTFRLVHLVIGRFFSNNRLIIYEYRSPGGFVAERQFSHSRGHAHL